MSVTHHIITDGEHRESYGRVISVQNQLSMSRQKTFRPRYNRNQKTRGVTNGWSAGVQRRFSKALGNLDLPAFMNLGLAVYSMTLTIRDCPYSSESWGLLRKKFMEKLEHEGMLACVHVTEWQIRGVPHLHMVGVFDSVIEYNKIINWWCGIARTYSPRPAGQHIRTVWDLAGIMGYFRSHMNKSGKSMQRDTKLIPKGWESTGRMWGFRGGCVFGQEKNMHIAFDDSYFAARRLLAQLAYAQIRAAYKPEWKKLSASVLYRNAGFNRWKKLMKNRKNYLSRFSDEHKKMITDKMEGFNAWRDVRANSEHAFTPKNIKDFFHELSQNSKSISGLRAVCVDCNENSVDVIWRYLTHEFYFDSYAAGCFKNIDNLARIKNNDFSVFN